eukprot:TRINITY_DN689_c0_g1_i1.p1 TRINITY_DN689_c0_g1~~TRINITY_DN689_c0_g1_i1.p1  ORF type:complete len:105 (-),score=2.40 TRINITY_DN689_c0_g1_i1:223-537(-)
MRARCVALQLARASLPFSLGLQPHEWVVEDVVGRAHVSSKGTEDKTAARLRSCTGRCFENCSDNTLLRHENAVQHDPKEKIYCRHTVPAPDLGLTLAWTPPGAA